MALQFGLIGRGPWARNIERTLLSLPGVSVLPIERGNISVSGLDAVLVATPSASHAQIALPYIKAGLATFIEKPMATATTDAELLRSAALQSGALVFVGHIYLHHPAFQKLLEILPSLGRIRYVLNDSANNLPRSDTSVLWDWLPHDLSMARAIFGTDASVAESWSLSGPGHTQAALSKFTFGDSSVLSTTSWLSSDRRKRLTVVCEGGTLVFDDRAQRKLELHDAQGNVSFPAYDAELPLTRELAKFTHAVRTRERDPLQLEAGVAVVRMIDAAESSLKRGGEPVEMGARARSTRQNGPSSIAQAPRSCVASHPAATMTFGAGLGVMRDDINRLRASVDSYLEREAWDDALDDLQVLWRLQPTQATAGFIAARAKRLAPHLRGTPLKVRFLRSFTVEPALPLLRAGALVLGIDLEPVVADFGVYAQEILDPQSPTYTSKPNVVVLALQTRDTAPELWTRGAIASAEALAAARTRVVDEFRSYVTSFRSRSQAQLIVHGLECLPIAQTGILDHQGPSGQIETTQLINHDLMRLCKQEGAYFLDYDGLVARYGRRLWLDERRWLDARLPIASGALPSLADEWLRFICPIAGRSAKCLVCDLDNTLWGGVVGEDGYDGIKLDGEYPGAAFQALQRAILDIADRGVILAIASKNNPEDALHVLREHPGMLLRPNHFAATRINWNPKAQSLREIAKELNIGIDSLVFLDDNPVERAHIRHEVPEVTVLELPEDPMAYADTLRSCPLFERLRLSTEDRERGQYYAIQRQRSELQAAMGSPDDYLRKLETVATVGRADDLTIPRIAQLTRKTNQFNLTTRRYSDEEIAALAAAPDAGVYWLKVTDRFGDNGLVGAAILKFHDGRSELDTFLLSCRVIGRTVEKAFLSRLTEEARSHKAGTMTAWFLPTAKNEPAKDFLPKHGFQLVEETPAGSHWELGADQAVQCPEWIKMTNP